MVKHGLVGWLWAAEHTDQIALYLLLCIFNAAHTCITERVYRRSNGNSITSEIPHRIAMKTPLSSLHCTPYDNGDNVVEATTAAEAAQIAKKEYCNYVLWCVCEFVAHSHLLSLSICLSSNIWNNEINFPLYHTTHTSGHCHHIRTHHTNTLSL